MEMTIFCRRMSAVRWEASSSLPSTRKIPTERLRWLKTGNSLPWCWIASSSGFSSWPASSARLPSFLRRLLSTTRLFRWISYLMLTFPLRRRLPNCPCETSQPHFRFSLSLSLSLLSIIVSNIQLRWSSISSVIHTSIISIAVSFSFFLAPVCVVLFNRNVILLSFKSTRWIGYNLFFVLFFPLIFPCLFVLFCFFVDVVFLRFSLGFFFYNKSNLPALPPRFLFRIYLFFPPFISFYSLFLSCAFYSPCCSIVFRLGE